MKIKWRRLLVEPRTHVDAVDGDLVRLRIDGLVCSDVCAVRSREALEGIEGVRSVDIDFERGLAKIHGTPADAATYDRAVRSVVVGDGAPGNRACQRGDHGRLRRRGPEHRAVGAAAPAA